MMFKGSRENYLADFFCYPYTLSGKSFCQKKNLVEMGGTGWDPPFGKNLLCSF